MSSHLYARHADRFPDHGGAVLAVVGPGPGGHLRRRPAAGALHRGMELAAEGARTRCRKRSLRARRCRVATGEARLLDTDSRRPRCHPVRSALSRGEGQRADLPHLAARARQRHPVPHLRSAVQQRHVLLDLVHAASGLRHTRRRIARISRGCATCRATSTSRSSTCAPAWRAATRCRACR